MSNGKTELRTASPAESLLPAVRAAGFARWAALALMLYLTMLPVSMIVPVLKELAAQRFGASSGWAHTFMSLNLLAAAVVGPLVARLSDRWRRRRSIIIAAALVNSAALALMPLAAGIATWMALRVIEGAAHITVLSLGMALAGDYAPRAARGRFMGLVGSAMMAGTATGASIGGMVGRENPIAVLELGALLALVSGALASFVLRDVASDEFTGRDAGAMRLVRESPTLRLACAYALVERFAVGVIISTFALFLGSAHGMTPPQIGTLLSGLLIPFALLCYPVGRWLEHTRVQRPLWLSTATFALLFGLYGYFPKDMLPVVMIASGVLSAMMFAPTLALCASSTTPDRRAVAFAAMNTAGSIGFLCGPIFGGIVSTAIRSQWPKVTPAPITMALAGACVLLLAALTIPSRTSEDSAAQ